MFRGFFLKPNKEAQGENGFKSQVYCTEKPPHKPVKIRRAHASLQSSQMQPGAERSLPLSAVSTLAQKHSSKSAGCNSKLLLGNFGSHHRQVVLEMGARPWEDGCGSILSYPEKASCILPPPTDGKTYTLQSALPHFSLLLSSQEKEESTQNHYRSRKLAVQTGGGVRDYM